MSVIELNPLIKVFLSSDVIQPVKLPSTDISVGTVVTPTGWGRPSDSKSIPLNGITPSTVVIPHWLGTPLRLFIGILMES